MANNNRPISIPNSLRNFSKEFPYIGESVDIYDENSNMSQDEINALVLELANNSTRKIVVTDVTALTANQLDALNCDDVVIKRTGTEEEPKEHCYHVAYKDPVNGELSLVYADHENIEEVYYEKTGGVWGYVQTDITPLI